jgi:hypothetical protein
MKNSSFVTIFIQNNNWLVLYKKIACWVTLSFATLVIKLMG